MRSRVWIISAILLGFSPVPLEAADEKIAKFFVRPQFGVAMPDFREATELLRSVVAGSGVTQVTDEASMALAFGLELGYLLKPELGDKGRMGTSLRVGFLSGEVKAEGTGLATPVVASLKNTLISITAGVWAQGGRDKGFHYRTGGGLGLGLASSDVAYDTPSAQVAYALSGMGLVFDVSGEWGYAVHKDVRIYIQAGFIAAKIGKMGLKASVDVNKDGLIGPGEEEGSILSDTRGQPLPFNFSGPRGQLGFAVGF